LERAVKSNTVSFRIPSDLEDALRTEASDRQVTLNAFVINTLRTSLQFAKVCKQFPFMPITGKTLAALLQHMDEDALRTIARECVVPQVTEISRIICGGANPSTLMDLLSLFQTDGFCWFTSVARAKVNKNDRFTARHGLGAKFSFFTGEIIKHYLETIGLPVTYESTENFVIIDTHLNSEGPEAAD